MYFCFNLFGPYHFETSVKKIIQECLDEVKMDRSIFNDVAVSNDAIIIPQDDIYKKFLVCSYKKQGFLSSDGKRMVYENLFEFLGYYYNKFLLRQLEVCKRIESDDPGELCFKNLECILKVLSGLKSLSTNMGENEIAR
ncbi:hypothetical protein ABEB36_007390 [Hypothenemus hampei]|uniref:Uncharacterized protein n=1 Tax=Hypothenemus hampei TaxID=57062 RepID=A0ABD1ETY0_HYPHA